MARTPRKNYPVGEPWNIETPWRQEAEHYLDTDQASTHDEAFGMVILRYLKDHGDARPLVDLFREGRAPQNSTLWEIATFFDECILDDESTRPNYKISVSARNKNRKPSEGELPWLNYLIARNVERLIDANGNYDSAIKDVADIVGKGEKTVRNAYDHKEKNPFYGN